MSPADSTPTPKPLNLCASLAAWSPELQLPASLSPSPMSAIHPSLPKSIGIPLQGVTIAGRIRASRLTPSSYGPSSRFSLPHLARTAGPGAVLQLLRHASSKMPVPGICARLPARHREEDVADSLIRTGTQSRDRPITRRVPDMYV